MENILDKTKKVGKGRKFLQNKEKRSKENGSQTYQLAFIYYFTYGFGDLIFRIYYRFFLCFS